ncbi:MAG: hypothetical protein AABY64_14605 [Bdellovibrionota bacterium]
MKKLFLVVTAFVSTLSSANDSQGSEYHEAMRAAVTSSICWTPYSLSNTQSSRNSFIEVAVADGLDYVVNVAKQDGVVLDGPTLNSLVSEGRNTVNRVFRDRINWSSPDRGISGRCN